MALNGGEKICVLGVGLDAGSQTAIQIDTDWTYETAGKKAVYLRFPAQHALSNDTLVFYAYCTAVTGTPTFKAELRAGAAATEDPDEPKVGGSALATSADVSPTASRWATFTLTGVTLTAGQTYFIVIYNTNATPASNYASWCYRGACDNHTIAQANDRMAYFIGGYTTDGFTSGAPTYSNNGTGPFVLRYGTTAGQNVHGFPYVALDSAHANNANYRGNRWRFNVPTKVHGVFTNTVTTSMSSINIFYGASEVVAVSVDETGKNKCAGTLLPSTELAANTDYDIVIGVTGTTTAATVYTMGEAEANLPADVLACRFASYVDGATPGSFTVDNSKIYQQEIEIDIANLVSGGLLTHPGMSGGLRG